MSEPDTTTFLNRCQARLSAGAVLPADQWPPYAASCLARPCAIAGVVQPISPDEVITLVRLAAESAIPLYPISTGHNWAYGEAHPARDGSIIVDLARMNRIIAFDPESGLLTLEPGVTQRQLDAFLQQHRYPFLIPVTGAGPDCSLLGNALERGYGITPYADHFSAVMSLEAVLPNGTLYRPMLDLMGGQSVNRAFKWGLGPYVDGLFTQGNFGIVTQMTLALAPRPERIEAFFFSVKTDDDLESAVERIRQTLREVGAITGSINLMNRHRVLAMAEPYPRDRLSPEGLIPADVLEELARRHQATAWTGVGAMYGHPRLVAAARPIIKRLLRPVTARLVFLTPGLVGSLHRWAEKLPLMQQKPLAKTLATLAKTMRLFAGQPSEIALPLAYWRSGQPPPAGEPMNPARDGCGLIWYSPLVPMQPAAVRAYTEMVGRICRAHRIEPLITLTSVSDRCFDSTVPILFDRADPAAIDRAHACYDALFAAGQAMGCVPYRLGVQSMALLNEHDAVPDLLKRLKQAVDPQGVIAPGRYGLG